ncbi:hypothetical protein CsatB_013136 [Cannabis sativa]
MKLVCFFSSSLSSHFSIISFDPITNLFMQNPKNSNTTRNTHRTKPWYQKAMEVGSLWRTISNYKSTTTNDTTNTLTLWKTISKTTTELSSGSTTTTSNSNRQNNTTTTNNNKLRKCSSLKVATSLTRVCLCAPISSYNEVFRRVEMNNNNNNIPPRRSNSYPRSSSSSSNHHIIKHINNNQDHQIRVSSTSGRHSMEGSRRVIFRGKSLSEDVLMRRFVVDEEASMMKLRRRNQMELIRRGNLMKRNKLGPSPLSSMVMATPTHHQI